MFFNFGERHAVTCILRRKLLRENLCDRRYIASEKAWQEIAEEWNFRLPKSYLDADGRYSFKMMQMMKSEERKSRIPWFYKIIEEKVSLAVSVAMSVADVESAKKRIFVDHPEFNIDRVIMDDLDDAYVFCCIILLQAICTQRDLLKDFIDPHERIDFVFDEKSEKQKVLKAWDDFMPELSDEDRSLYGARPRFEDDKIYLPLQAADMWAWWVREAAERSLARGGAEVAIDFGGLLKEGKQSMGKFHHQITEDSIAYVYQKQARLSIHKDFKVYDLKYRTFI